MQKCFFHNEEHPVLGRERTRQRSQHYRLPKDRGKRHDDAFLACLSVCSFDGDDGQEGKKAPPGRFPYMCSLRRRGSREHVCGATLFRRDWILTAAHCVDSRIEETSGLSPVVHCGIYKLDEIDPDKASDGRGALRESVSLVRSQVFDVIEGYMHEDWTGNVGDGNDIAVLKLNKKAKGLTLPLLGSGDVTITAGDYMAAAGWGTTESTTVAKTLRVTDRLAIVGQKHCEVPPNVTDAGSWLCAGGLGEDTCKGNTSHQFTQTSHTDHSRTTC